MARRWRLSCATKYLASQEGALNHFTGRQAMFEDSTFEFNSRIRPRSRGWMAAALVFNGSILVALILIPLIYPEALPRQSLSVLVEAPRPPEPPQPAPVLKATEKFRGVPQMDGATIIAP